MAVPGVQAKKVCRSCEEVKELSEFNKDSTRADGFHVWCRKCKRDRRNPISEEKKKSRAEYIKRWKAENPDKVKASAKRCQKKPKPRLQLSPERIERAREIGRNCYHRNKHKPENKAYRDKSRMLRKSRVRKAIPRNLPEHLRKEIVIIYDKCREMNSFHEAVVYHVDHIEPIAGVNFCGLHVPWNLRIIPAVENISKSNKLITI